MSIDRGMDKDVVHIYKGILAIKKNKTMPFAATWMDLEIIILSKIRQRQIFICGILKNGTNELTYKTEIESQMQKTNLPGGAGRGINWETGIDIYTLLYIK